MNVLITLSASTSLSYQCKKGLNLLWPGVPQTRMYCSPGQLLTTCTAKVDQWATPSCSRSQPDADNGVRDDRSN